MALLPRRVEVQQVRDEAGRGPAQCPQVLQQLLLPRPMVPVDLAVGPGQQVRASLDSSSQCIQKGAALRIPAVGDSRAEGPFLEEDREVACLSDRVDGVVPDRAYPAVERDFVDDDPPEAHLLHQPGQIGAVAHLRREEAPRVIDIAKVVSVHLRY